MSKSVSDAFKLFLRYLLFCIAGTVCVSILFWIYGLCRSFVSGEKLVSFSFSILVFGLRKYAPVVMECSVVFMAICLVGKWRGNVLPLVVYVLLGLGTWFGLCPLWERNVVPADSQLEQKMSQVEVSSGFFRQFGDGVLYYVSVDDGSVADGVFIDLKGGDRKVLTFEKMKVDGVNQSAEAVAGGAVSSGVALVTDGGFSEQHGGLGTGNASGTSVDSSAWNGFVDGYMHGVRNADFTDSLIEEQVRMPYVVERGLAGIEAFCAVQKKVAGQGWIAWLWFASAGVALISCAGLMNASRWKLLNGVLVVIFSVFVLVMNTFFYLPETVFTGGINWVNGVLKFASFARNQTAVLFNLVLTVTMTVLGIIFDVRAAREMKEDGE